jgi:AraC family transcriptional activator of pobA
MEETERCWYFSGIGPQSGMKPAPLLLVPFREVRHDQPDDCLHYEPWRFAARKWTGRFRRTGMRVCTSSSCSRGAACAAPSTAALRLPRPGAADAGARFGARLHLHSRDAIGHQVTMPTATLRGLLGGSALAETALGASFILGRSLPAARPKACALFEAVAREFRLRPPGRVHACSPTPRCWRCSSCACAARRTRREAARRARHAGAALPGARRAALPPAPGRCPSTPRRWASAPTT